VRCRRFARSPAVIPPRPPDTLLGGLVTGIGDEVAQSPGGGHGDVPVWSRGRAGRVLANLAVDLLVINLSLFPKSVRKK
jgi:hypothetical protein